MTLITLANLQARVSTALLANAALALLGTPFAYNPKADPKSTEEAMATVRRTTGVAIEIGEPWIVQAESFGAGASGASLFVELFLSESIGQTHTPEGLVLADTIIAAMAAADFTVLDTAESYVSRERGYVLRVLSFSRPGRWSPP